MNLHRTGRSINLARGPLPLGRIEGRGRQNRRQKVFNRGLCVSAGGLCVCAVREVLTF